jgi:hypothetical protein
MRKYILFENKETLVKWGKNLLKFTAPALALFFFQLSQKVPVEVAGGVALLALWGILADALKKIGEEKK